MFAILITAVILISAGRGQCPSRCHCTKYKTICSLARLNTLPSGLPNGTEFMQIELDHILRLDSSIIVNTGLSDLLYLALNNVQLEEIEPGTFEKMNLLESLIITHNNMSDLKADTFKFLNKLYYLDLSNNNILNLNSGSFSGLTNLRHLYLRENKINRLPANTFQDMKNSSNCGMIRTPGVLDLSGNYDWYFVENGVFQNVCTFTHFNLDLFSAESITKGAFVGLTRAIKLSFSMMCPLIRSPCKLTNLFNGPSGLVYLEMIDGSIKDIEIKAFENLKLLKHLDLSNNFIRKIRRGTFKGLDSLKQLKLDFNTIFTLKTGGFQYLGSLELLQLSFCKIQKIEPGAFNGLIQLRILDLTDNNIEMLANNTFFGLPRLRDLNLDDNKIKIIEGAAFCGLTSLKILSYNEPDRLIYLKDEDVNAKITYQISRHEVTFEMLTRLDVLEFSGSFKSLRGIQVLNYLQLYMDDESTGLQQKLQVLLETVHNVTNFMLTLISLDSPETLATLSGFQIPFLRIETCNLPGLRNNSFSGLLELRYLAIENCGTLIIEKNAFHQLKTLIELRFSFNQHLIIENGSFSGLNFLKYLYLSYSHIEGIGRASFLGLDKLELVNLQNNDIKYLGRGTFQGLDNIEEIYLQNNDLEEINAGVFGAVCDEEFELSCKNASSSSPFCNHTNSLRTLKYLDLSWNEITYIHPHAFISCIKLHTLNISYNNLFKLDNLFLFTPTLRELSMIHCNITNIPNNTFECTPFLSQISLSIYNTKFNITPLLPLKNLQIFDIYGSVVRNVSFCESWLWFHMNRVSYYIRELHVVDYDKNQQSIDGAALLNLNCTLKLNVTLHNTNTTRDDFVFFKTYIEPVVLAFLFMLGLVFNGFLLFISFRQPEMRTKQNTCIIHLAIVDILSLILNIPLSYWDVVNITWELGETICKVFIITKDVMMGASVLSIIALSLERYLIARNFSNIQCDISEKVPTTWLLMMTWISSTVISLPSYFSATVDVRCLYCPPDNEDYIKRVWTFQFIIYSLLPAIVIVYLNVMTSSFMRESIRNIPGEIKNSCIIQNRKVTGNMVLILLVVFVICYTPNFILRLLRVWSVLNIENMFLISFFSFCLFFCNTICNPISIFVMSSKYKSHFLTYFPFITNEENVISSSNLKKTHCVQGKHFERLQKSGNFRTIYAKDNIHMSTTSSAGHGHTSNRNSQMDCVRYFTKKFNKFNDNTPLIVTIKETCSQENDIQTSQSSLQRQDDLERIQQARMERLAKLQKRFL